MLGRCGPTTPPAKNIPPIRRTTPYTRCNAANNRSAAFAGLRAFSGHEPSLDGSPTSSPGRMSLPPSPTFRKCLLPSSTTRASESAVLWQLSYLLKRKGDVARLVSVLTGHDNPIQTLNGFNALFSRLRCLQDSIPPALVLDAMQCAAKDPTAMKTLLGLYSETITHDSKDQEQTHEGEWILWFERLAKKILSAPASQQGSSIEERTVSQWIWVLAGWDGGVSERGAFPMPPAVREYCLFDLGPRKYHRCWPIYMELLLAHGGGRLLANEWEKFVAEDVGTTGSFPDTASAQSIGENLNATISALLRLGDPERAWSIAYGPGNIIELVSRKNLRTLLTHPDLLKSWRPELNEAALETLDVETQKIEKFLGTRWAGDEDGFHRSNTAS